jgi:hypothetical protein
MKSMFLAGVLAASAIAAAGCGGGGGSTNTTSQDAAARDAAVKYSQCMREHGIAKFPDPDAQGRMMLRAGPGTGIDPESPQFKSAQQACKKYSPKAGAKFDPARAQQMQAAALRFAQCMRQHGVDFPDPKFEDGGAKMTFGGPGLNPKDPKFQSAQQACSKNLPQGGPGGSVGLGGPQ